MSQYSRGQRSPYNKPPRPEVAPPRSQRLLQEVEVAENIHYKLFERIEQSGNQTIVLIEYYYQPWDGQTKRTDKINVTEEGFGNLVGMLIRARDIREQERIHAQGEQ